MGPPGSGKGTQAALLGALGWITFSTGELLRSYEKLDTPLGKLVHSYISKGQYVPDDVMVQMVREQVAAFPLDRRVLFDGFPRTAPQAGKLDELLAESGRSLGQVVALEADLEEVVKRLALRQVAQGRNDDHPDTVKKRYATYLEQTAPLIAYYEKRGLLKYIEGKGTPEEIGIQVAKAFDNS